MTRDEQDQKWAPTFTVRLEPELAERLRVAAFTHRVKKQPILRIAVERLLSRENARTDAAIRKRWAAIVASQPAATTVKEALRMSPAEDEILRLFCYKHRLHKQVIVRTALVEHLNSLETKRKP